MEGGHETQTGNQMNPSVKTALNGQSSWFITILVLDMEAIFQTKQESNFMSIRLKMNGSCLNGYSFSTCSEAKTICEGSAEIRIETELN